MPRTSRTRAIIGNVRDTGSEWNNASLIETSGSLKYHGTGGCYPHDGAISFVFVKRLETATPEQKL